MSGAFVVQVSVSSSYGSSWGATVDLEAGTITAAAGGPTRPIAADALAELRAEAEAAHAGGPVTVREQHADGIVELVVTRNGTSVRLAYETWGEGDYAAVKRLWAYVRRAS